MTFLVGVFIGMGVGVAAAALALRISSDRELEDLRHELKVKTLVLQNAARMARPIYPTLSRYIAHVLDDEAGA